MQTSIVANFDKDSSKYEKAGGTKKVKFKRKQP